MSALGGKRVLITRPQQQSAEFAEALRARGAEPLFAPLIQIEPPDDPSAAERALAQITTYRWIVLTSSNAVDALCDFADATNRADTLRGVKIAAIGPATAAALAARGLHSDLVPPQYVSESLASELVQAATAGDRVLVFRAQEARDILPETLRAAGIAVDVVAAYKTVTAHPSDFSERVAQADVVTFASASAVRGFCENGGTPELLRTKTVACIGPVTAQAAREAGLEPAVVARDSTAAGLAQAIEDRLASTASVSHR